MTLFKMWTGCAIEALPAVFKVDLATALRNVALAEGALASTRILPTDRAIMGGARRGRPPRRGAGGSGSRRGRRQRGLDASAGGTAGRPRTGQRAPPGRGRGDDLQDAGRVRRGRHHTLQGPRACGEGKRDRVPAAPPAGRGTSGRLPGGRVHAGRRAR